MIPGLSLLCIVDVSATMAARDHPHGGPVDVGRHERDTATEELIAFLASAGETHVPSLIINGMHTWVLEAVGGHLDTTGNGIRDVMMLENKITLPRGQPSRDLLLRDIPPRGPMPAGFLGFVRQKVATCCEGLSTIEVHQLSDEWHLCRCGREYVESVLGVLPPQGKKGIRYVDNLPNPRGVWWNGRFYLHGRSLTDWGSAECLK